MRLIVIAALLAGSISAQTGGTRAIPQVQTAFDSMELVAAGTDHLRFEVHAHVTSARSVTLTRVRFEQMTVADVPFYLSPIEGPLELKAGRPYPLPAIPMTIYFRDFDSLKPVEAAIQNSQVRVRGHALADVGLNLLEKLALREWSAHADVPIDNPIAVEMPGGFAGRTAAMLALRAAEAALGMAGSALNVTRTSQKTWSNELQGEYGQSVVIAETHYTLRMGDGQNMQVSSRGLGFRISEDRIVIPGALAEPWKYDSETALLTDTGKASVVSESHDILVWPGEARLEDAASLLNGRLKIEKIAAKAEPTELPDADRTARVNLAKRDSDSNYAILRFTADSDKRKALPAAQSDRGGSWDRVAVYRLTEDGPPEMIFVPARWDGNRLVFDTPVDDGAIGSPVMTPEGGIGMLQDEHSGMALKSDW